MTPISFNFYKKQTYFKAFILAIICMTGGNFWAQNISVEGPYYLEQARRYHKVETISNPVNVERSAELKAKMSARNACSTINTIYTGFTAEAVQAFEFAVEIWEASLESSVPITVSAEFTSLNEDIVAFTEPNGFFTIAGTGVPDTLYPKALAEQLTDSEIGDPDSIDILVTIDTDKDFYFGLDANPPAGTIDFVTLVLHQLGHGLGFVGFGITNGTVGQIRDSTDGLPSIYDRFVENGTGTAILSFPDPSTDLHAQLTGDDLFSNAPAAVTANSGNEPKIYSASPFDFFKNYDHWDSSAFPSGNINSLMTETMATGQANHNPGPVTLGLLEDMGWTLCQTLSVDSNTMTSFRLIENPVKDALHFEVRSNLMGSSVELSVFNMGGQLVFNKSQDIQSNVLTVSGLGKLAKGLYFVTLTEANTGNTITEKFLKDN